MKRNWFRQVAIILLTITISLSVCAHGGKTDSNGGHKDNKNKSGLGNYHYHCGGNPPHLHNDDVCPYIENIPKLSEQIMFRTEAKNKDEKEKSIKNYPESSKLVAGSICLALAIVMAYFFKRKIK